MDILPNENVFQQFNFTGFVLRGKLVNNEPIFIGADACKALDLKNPWDALGRLDEDDLGITEVIDSMGRPQKMKTVNESGLYQLIFQSRTDGAKAFKKWVTSEVLPTIRKTGSYSAQIELPKSYSEALRELATTVEAKERLELENKTLKPKAQQFEEFMGAKGTFTAEQAAKLLCRAGINTGQNRLLKYMDSIGWTSKSNRFAPRLAVQRFVDQKLIDVQGTKYKHPKTGEIVVGDPKIVITPKGLHKLRELMLPPMDIELLEVA